MENIIDTLTIQPQLVLTESISLDQHPVAVYLASLTSYHSRRTMKTALNTIARNILNDDEVDAFAVNWSQMRYQHTAAIRAMLMEQYKPATANKILSALRGVLREAWQLGYMSAEDYHRAVAVKSIRAETLPAGRELSRGELEALLAACNADLSPAGIRDGALIATLYTGGLRRAEIVALNMDDYKDESGKLIVRGKGRKERTVYLPSSTGAYVQRWLSIRGETDGALFVPINKGGRFTVRAMTSQAVYFMLQKRAEQAGVSAFSPHDVRRTFVSDLLDAGADIAIVSKLAGHASVTPTARYDRRPEEAKKKAAGLLHVPEPPERF